MAGPARCGRSSPPGGKPGRAALGDPWMIYRTVEYLESGELKPEPTAQEKIDVCLLHFDRLTALKGEGIAVREMRKHAAWYLKGVRGNANVRNAINECETRDHLVSILNGMVQELEEKQNQVNKRWIFATNDQDNEMDYDSMINLRQSWGNRSRSVEDPKIRDRIRNIVNKLVLK